MKSGEVVLELVGRARPPSCALLLDELICKRIVFRQRIVPGLDQKRHVRVFQPPRASATFAAVVVVAAVAAAAAAARKMGKDTQRDEHDPHGPHHQHDACPVAQGRDSRVVVIGTRRGRTCRYDNDGVRRERLFGGAATGGASGVATARLVRESNAIGGSVARGRHHRPAATPCAAELERGDGPSQAAWTGDELLAMIAAADTIRVDVARCLCITNGVADGGCCSAVEQPQAQTQQHLAKRSPRSTVSAVKSVNTDTALPRCADGGSADPFRGVRTAERYM